MGVSLTWVCHQLAFAKVAPGAVKNVPPVKVFRAWRVSRVKRGQSQSEKSW